MVNTWHSIPNPNIKIMILQPQPNVLTPSVWLNCSTKATTSPSFLLSTWHPMSNPNFKISILQPQPKYRGWAALWKADLRIQWMVQPSILTAMGWEWEREGLSCDSCHEHCKLQHSHQHQHDCFGCLCLPGDSCLLSCHANLSCPLISSSFDRRRRKRGWVKEYCWCWWPKDHWHRWKGLDHRLYW